MKTLRNSLLIGFLALPAVGFAQRVIGTPITGGVLGALYTVLGQPTTGDTTLASRCPNPSAMFNYSPNNGTMHGPSGIAVDPRGRVYVTDYAGHRVLTWPDSDSLQTCLGADAIIDAAGLIGPEAVAIDPHTETLFVADTLSHTVVGYQQRAGAWARFVTLGTSGMSGNGFNQFYFPRGLAVDSNGRLYVADDYNNRVLMFDPPFSDGQFAADSMGAGADGGFSHPKGLAISGQTLFVADYDKNRVLRFTGPFNTPDQVYQATGTFGGLNHPVDVAMHADGSLLVTDQGTRQVLEFADAVWADSTSTASSRIFANMLNPEPLGVACDHAGRVFIADYQAYRVIIGLPMGHAPISSGASMESISMLANLNLRPTLASGRVAIGQQLRTWSYGSKSDPNAWYGAILALQQQGLPLPKVLGGEMSDLQTRPGFSPNVDALNELIQHGYTQNIVTLVWHPDNPTGGDFSTPISTDDLRNMADSRTAVGQAWEQELDYTAAVLSQFQAQHVPVLFRPLHEQNGTFFWWGHDGSSGDALRQRQKAWVAMWRSMVNGLVIKRGLNNLLFVFGTNQVNYDGVAAPLTYYPGGSSADVVSIDLYQDNLNMAGDERGLQHYAALVSTGKPFGLAEFGQNEDGGTPNGAAWDARTLTDRIRDSYPRTAFAIAWYSSYENGTPYIFALPDISHTSDVLHDSLVETHR